jgi:RNA polymerase sigma-54 factor
MRQQNQLKLSLPLKQQQVLMISPQMQKALSLLQLPVMELILAVTSELEENPVLEYSEEESRIEENDLVRCFEEKYCARSKKNEDDISSLVENTLAYEYSLFESLMQQAREVFVEKTDLLLANLIIGNVDENGFLGTSLEEIALLEDVDIKELEKVLKVIQSFDPPGVCARDIQESLLIQLKLQGREKSLAYLIIEESYDLMTSNRIPLLAKKNSCSVEHIQEIIEKEISGLVLHPGISFSRGHYRENPQPIIPDVMITSSEKGFHIEVNEKSIPPFRINPHYLNMLTNESLPFDTRDYIQEKIASGKWLLRNLVERQKTLYRITEVVLMKQGEFFKSPEGNLKSLTMKEIADDLDLHESTIARAVSGKYVSSPRGLIPLRKLFTHAYATDSGGSLSAPAVKELLQKIISEEDPSCPLSDEALSLKMKEKGIPCARRTISKYRGELNLGSRSARKRH